MGGKLRGEEQSIGKCKKREIKFHVFNAGHGWGWIYNIE